MVSECWIEEKKVEKMTQPSKEPCKKEACNIQACLSKNNFLPQRFLRYGLSFPVKLQDNYPSPTEIVSKSYRNSVSKLSSSCSIAASNVNTNPHIVHQ
ncbi:uncharacterized protein LOC125204296 isoform X1 [Salvia hispanica]|uniref:uncharacterized protein LOC125204296 isoform X1 n=1 Tax=Salvia hispanica TaxID=49212 RepID=UPI002009D6A6|nr:uncharacterized protein LOC125204296 isoform X1 [Salvia hispanica]